MNIPVTLLCERGGTIPLLGRTEYFFGLVVFTCNRKNHAGTFKLQMHKRQEQIWI